MAPPDGIAPPTARHPRPAPIAVDPADDRETFVIYGDPQHDNEPQVMGLYRSDTVVNYAPGRRPLAANLGVGLTTDMLIRLHAPVSRSDRPRLIFMGDMVDTNTVQELETGFGVIDRLKKVDAANRLLLYMTSNHDHFFMGTTNSGHNALGVVGLGLNLQGSLRSHIKNIHGYEAGGMEHTLFKDKWIKRIYRRMFEQNADLPANKTVLRRVGEKDYELADGREAEWYESGRVAKDFWRPLPEDRWNALVFHGAKKTDLPEEQWLYLSAAKLKEVKTKTGSYPIYFISLDTMDFLEASSTTIGALTGHVSPEQVHMVRAFIAERKRENPRALFVLGGHYPVESISDFTESGLNHIFSYESVIGYVAAHAHRRGYDLLTSPELALKYQIKRRQPLAQIIVPAVMDYPNEIALFRVGTAQNNPNKIVLEFNFKGLDENDIPGNLDADGKPDTLCRELQAVRPELNDYFETLRRIRDWRIRGIANPHSEFVHNLNRLIDIDKGLIFDPGYIYDKIVGQDVLSVMVERVQGYSGLFTKTIKLLLVEGGLTEMAQKFDRVFTAATKHANHYYELLRYREALQLVKAEYQERNAELPEDVVLADQKLTAQLKAQVKNMNEHRRQLETIVPEVTGLCAATEQQLSAQQDKAKLLKMARDSINDLKIFVQEYQSWLKHYETTRNVMSNDSEILNDLDMFSRRSFRDLFKRLGSVPYGSQAAAFLIHAHLESAEQYKVYYNGIEALKQKVPDQIRLEIATHTNERTLTPLPSAKMDVPIKRRQWCIEPGGYQDYAGQDRAAAAELPQEENERPIEAHWNLQPNVFLGFGEGFHGGVSLAGGGYWHLWRRWDKWPGVNLSVHGEGLLAWQGRSTFDAAGRDVFGARVSGELNLKIAPTLSAFSIAELGPQLLVGVGRKGLGDAFPNDEVHYGIGGVVRLFEGLGSAQYIRQNATDGTSVNRIMFGFDVLTMGRLFDWWDREL